MANPYQLGNFNGMQPPGGWQTAEQAMGFGGQQPTSLSGGGNFGSPMGPQGFNTGDYLQNSGIMDYTADPYAGLASGTPPAGAMQGFPQNPYSSGVDPRYGYGNGPGQGNRGYYSQDTPFGSFVASENTWQPGQQYANQQTTNPYTIQGVGSIGQSANQNPYMGQATQQATASSNSMAGVNNPYLTRAIDAASQDATRNFQTAVLPQFDRMAQASGSFGNTGVEAARGDAFRQFGNELGNIATNARMQDYTAQQQLAENEANRRTGVSQFNSGLNAGDLNRNSNAYLQGSGLDQQGRMFDTSNQLGTQRYNADAYNTGGMFNASQGNQLGQFNAGQGNQLGMYGQGLRQQTNLANTGAANNFLTQGRNLYEQGRQFDQTLGQRGREFDANLDFGIDNSNWNRMRTGQQDQLNFLGQLFGFGNQGVGMANQLQNMPADQQAKWAQIATMLGGMGGTNSQNLQGDPLAGFLGGLGLGNGIYNYYTGGR